MAIETPQYVGKQSTQNFTLGHFSILLQQIRPENPKLFV